MVRANQGGSVLSFIIIGVIIVSLLVGGVYYVRQQIDTSMAESPQLEPQETEKKQPEKPAEAPSNAPAKEENNEQSSKQQDTPPPHASSGTPATKLPQTGPAELVATLLAIGLLSATATSYVRSRRPELSL